MMKDNKFENINTIFWDFDGVIMNSNAVRDSGFEMVLQDFPNEQVNQLLEFHQKNGGLSRYVKFRYFFEEILGQSITDEQVHVWAERFSKIMLERLQDKSILIEETVQFVEENYKNYKMIIVSGSDQAELRKICKAVDIAQYFERIHGSPKPKKEWVTQILEEENIDANSAVLIGDSLNDYEAAIHNGIKFYGFNNAALQKKNLNYIVNF
ncbi:HAD family hydrolase [Marivirga harenae]|uniref:HAD family hydrolase n=1 Tax=Marivirga harenae TaxID=2010992 RepID=UPI0026E040F8|nr:HAD-IA family hydrolase [Marivirga harenae]WKV11369.1 HAD-IA family hydrolase [Marivirga harenae]